MIIVPLTNYRHVVYLSIVPYLSNEPYININYNGFRKYLVQAIKPQSFRPERSEARKLRLYDKVLDLSEARIANFVLGHKVY